MRTIFHEAVRLGVIAIDPMNRTARHRGKAPEKAIPTPAEVGDLFAVARSPLARLFFEVAAATGAGAGSVRHLRWRDVDLETGSLYFGVTKEKRPYVVAIDDDTRASLADARRRAHETAMAIGSPQIANRYLFSSEADGPRRGPVGRLARLRATADQLDLDPGITLHSLRHFHATRCLTAGIPAKDVATRLGCTEANVIRTYSHRVESGNDRKAADLIGALLQGCEVGMSAARCEWFALCDRPATRTRTHPVLGEVPICDRCDAKVEAIEATPGAHNPTVVAQLVERDVANVEVAGSSPVYRSRRSRSSARCGTS